MKQKSDVYLVMAYIQLKFIIYLVPFHNVWIRNRLSFSAERTFYLDHSLSMSILENNRICDNRIRIVESLQKKVVIEKQHNQTKKVRFGHEISSTFLDIKFKVHVMFSTSQGGFF